MTINSFDDILKAMEQDPALREAMRRHILTEELLQLPAQVTRLETSMAQLQDGQSRLETRMDGLAWKPVSPAWKPAKRNSRAGWTPWPDGWETSSGPTTRPGP